MHFVKILQSLKALLHYAIVTATCRAMFENVALQVAEVGCYTTTQPQQLAIFLAFFSYPELRGMKNEKCAHAFLLKLP